MSFKPTLSTLQQLMEQARSSFNTYLGDSQMPMIIMQRVFGQSNSVIARTLFEEGVKEGASYFEKCFLQVWPDRRYEIIGETNKPSNQIKDPMYNHVWMDHFQESISRTPERTLTSSNAAQVAKEVYYAGAIWGIGSMFTAYVPLYDNPYGPSKYHI